VLTAVKRYKEANFIATKMFLNSFTPSPLPWHCYENASMKFKKLRFKAGTPNFITPLPLFT
jgi:hypothetical protein